MISFLKKFFSTDSESINHQDDVKPIEYKGFRIYVQPRLENHQYRVAGFIEKDSVVSDSPLRHEFIRSDLCMDKSQAEQLTLHKCQVFIDQMGESIFS